MAQHGNQFGETYTRVLGKNVYVFLVAELGVYMCPRCTLGNALSVSDRGVVLPTVTAVLSAVPRDADNFS